MLEFGDFPEDTRVSLPYASAAVPLQQVKAERWGKED